MKYLKVYESDSALRVMVRIDTMYIDQLDSAPGGYAIQMPMDEIMYEAKDFMGIIQEILKSPTIDFGMDMDGTPVAFDVAYMMRKAMREKYGVDRVPDLKEILEKKSRLDFDDIDSMAEKLMDDFINELRKAVDKQTREAKHFIKQVIMEAETGADWSDWYEE